MSLRPDKRIKSFGHALRGIALLVRTQPNAWIHLLATLLVVIAGVVVDLKPAEWSAVVLAIGLVWVAEALNTGIEFLADEVSQEHRDLIGKAKDVGAAGVLLAAICAVVVGAIVFLPHVPSFGG